MIAVETGADDVFDIETRSEKGVRRIRHSRNLIFAIGYFDHPNFIGVPGEDLPHVSHYYSEPHGFYRKNVVIVGGGNSAAETALELYRAGAHVTLVHRHPQLKPSIKYWVRPDIENRIKEGSVRGLFNTKVVEIQPTQMIVERDGAREEIPADAVFVLTGYHPIAICTGVPASACIATRCRRSSMRRRSRQTCPACFSRAAPSAAGTPRTSSSKTGASTARRSSRPSRARMGKHAAGLSLRERVRWQRADGPTEIRPPSVRAETINVVKAAAAIVFIVAAYIFRPAFGAPADRESARAQRDCFRIKN